MTNMRNPPPAAGAMEWMARRLVDAADLAGAAAAVPPPGDPADARFPEGPTEAMRSLLRRAGSAVASELARAAGVPSAFVQPLLKHDLATGRVLVDRSSVPYRYVLQSDAAVARTRVRTLTAQSGLAQAELLEWQDDSRVKPDSDTTVLVFADGEWFSGWWDDERGAWFDCASGATVDGVTHWAEPEGPTL